MKMNLNNAVSNLSNIPEKYLDKLTEKALYSINDGIAETVTAEEDLLEIETGLGTLYIGIADDTVKYKFVASEHLDNTIKNTIINGQNLLEDKLEKSLVNKFIAIYKDTVC